MPRYIGPSDFRHDAPACTGILLSNLGTPEAPTPSAVRRYLAEFLADPRVVEFPRLLWWLVLHGIILRVRPRKVARAYASIWSEAGSPLLAISKRQAQALQTALSNHFAGPIKVALAMRYGTPSIATGMEALRQAGAQRILVLPLYPQYSGSTTASTQDAVADVLRTWRWVPELRFVASYQDHPAYIAALAASVREHWQQHGQEKLLMSFHGIPKRYLLAGDPYHCQCLKTGRLLAAALGLQPEQYYIAFQSRFGREEWLKPYADKTLQQWARDGLKKVQVVCPGFSADCLETLEEIAEQNQELFIEAGGEALQYIPALNDRPDHIQALVELIQQHTSGWRETAPDYDAQAHAAQRKDSLQRARDTGAGQ